MFFESRTIAAIATGQAVGGVGIVRISGEKAIELADKVFRAASGKSLAESKGYQAHYGRVFDNSGWSDEAIALVFRTPHSYTGEDVVEISCHGGLTTTRLALKACIDAGCEPAAAGEFTRRAFENGKISLEQAEAVMAIISAEGRQAALAAGSAHAGKLGEKVENISKELTSLSASIAAWCDFPDEEEIPAVDLETIILGLEKSKASLEELTKKGRVQLSLMSGIETVICGKPNVGKSTLMNLLSGCEKSIVTDIPGTTRDVVSERVEIGNVVLRLSDTAGIHNTNDKIETIGVELAKRSLENAALVMAVFDGSRELDAEDKALIKSVRDRLCIAVINKGDKPQIINDKYIKRYIKQIVYISAAKSLGINELEAAITKAVESEHLDPASGVIINERQLGCAAKALEAVCEALDGAKMGFTFDAINVSISYAINSLLELTGQRAEKIVADEVFSKFCVGK